MPKISQATVDRAAALFGRINETLERLEVPEGDEIRASRQGARATPARSTPIA